MEPAFSIISDAPDGRVVPRRLSGRVLARLIEISFASQAAPCAFRSALRDFAEAYFILSLEDGIRFQRPTPEVQAVEALAQALDDAVTSGQLARLTGPSRLVALTTLTSLASLQAQVMDGALARGEAVSLFMTIVFEGVQASPCLSRSFAKLHK